MTSKKIALKSYLKAISDECAPLSKQELTQVILGLAKDKSPADRIDFLAQFRSVLHGKTPKPETQIDVAALVKDIRSLKEAVLERIDILDGGDYSELEDWDWEDAEWDEVPEPVSDAQANALADFFDKAGDLFVDGDARDARQVYDALFDLVRDIRECEYVLPEFAMDLRTERARYARCVYETTGEENRLDDFADAMDLQAGRRFMRHRIDDAFPLLRDVMDTRDEPMADLASFYPVWRDLLSTQGTWGRPASLTAEATFLVDGFEGIAGLARAWGKDQPHGYLFWLEQLKQAELAGEITDVAREALDVLPGGEPRQNVSAYLVDAGAMLGDDARVLAGKREIFFSHPRDKHLLALMEEAQKQDKRDECLAKLLSFFQNLTAPDDAENSLRIKCLLMAGRLDDAWHIVKDAEGLGWSYGLNTGLVFSAALAASVNRIEDTPTVKNLLARYAEQGKGYTFHVSQEKAAGTICFETEIMAALKRTDPSEFGQYAEWAIKKGKQRVDDIVSNKHRGAYDRAAMVLGAMAESLAATSRPDTARDLMIAYCKQKYPRHIAFRREVKKVIGNSKLLNSLNVGF